MHEKIYLVLIAHSSGTRVISAHRTKDGARKAWNKARLALIKQYADWMRGTKNHHFPDEITHFSCAEPDKMEPSIYETPIIKEIELLI